MAAFIKPLSSGFIGMGWTIRKVMGSGAKAKKISRKLLIKEISLRILAKKIILPKEEKKWFTTSHVHSLFQAFR